MIAMVVNARFACWCICYSPIRGVLHDAGSGGFPLSRDGEAAPPRVAMVQYRGRQPPPEEEHP